MASSQAHVYHNLSVMFDAGLPALRSLRTAAAGARQPLRAGLLAVAEDVATGRTIAEAMGERPKVFAPMDVLLVEVGETSGNLAECLKCLSGWYEFRGRLRRTITSAVLLPLLVFHAAALIVPLPGVFLGRISTGGYLLQVLGMLAVLYVPAGAIWATVRLTPRQGRLRRLLDGLLVHMPLAGPAVRQLALSRYSRAFHMLYGSGVPIVRAAELSAEAAGNAVMTQLLAAGTQSARAGTRVSEGFDRRLPQAFRDAWQIGEETGALDEAVRRLGETAAEAAQERFVALATWLPRVFYFLLCIYMASRVLSGYAMIR